MARLWDLEGGSDIGLEALIDHLESAGPDLFKHELDSTAAILHAFGENRSLLPDLLQRHLGGERVFEDAGSPQAFVLVRCRFFTLRAVIWDAPSGLQGEQMFLYGLPHDHDFSFFTLGWFGPGYETVVRTYDHASVIGLQGESVVTGDEARWRLDQGRVAFFEGGRDIHCQLPPSSLSVSFNVLQNLSAYGKGRRQYEFDTGFGSVRRVLNGGPMALLIRAACASGGELVQQVVEIARHASNDYERAVAFRALASVDPGLATLAQADNSAYVRATAWQPLPDRAGSSP